eukprot:scaffold15226_cov58-Phaeocystis_antarctica.AAC.2
MPAGTLGSGLVLGLASGLAWLEPLTLNPNPNPDPDPKQRQGGLFGGFGPMPGSMGRGRLGP